MRKRSYHEYIMACGHHGHRWALDGRPMCIFCKPPESRTVVAIEETLPGGRLVSVPVRDERPDLW